MSCCSCSLSRYLTTNYPIHHTKSPTTLICFSPNPRFATSSLSKKFSLSVAEVEDDDVLHDFIKDRATNGDIITQITDSLWLRDAKDIINAETGLRPDSSQISMESIDEESEGGFLKLKTTTEWLLGDNTAPVNKKVMIEEFQNDKERRKRLNLLKYEALKKELLLLTVGIGTACSGYCLIALSFQTAFCNFLLVIFRVKNWRVIEKRYDCPRCRKGLLDCLILL